MDGIYIKSDGKTLKAYRIQMEPVLIMQNVPGRHIIPGTDRIYHAEDARAIIEDLKNNGSGQIVTPKK